MSVATIIEITAESPESFEQAIRQGIEMARGLVRTRLNPGLIGDGIPGEKTRVFGESWMRI